MQWSMDNIYTAAAIVDQQQFLMRIEDLLNGRRPQYLWVENTSVSYKYWRLQELYLCGNRLVRDAAFSCGGYTLIIHKGSILSKEGNLLVFTGGYTFRKDGFCYRSHSVSMNEEGHFLFEIEVSGPEDLAMGFRYFTRGWDPFLMRWDVVWAVSDAVAFSRRTLFNVELSPLVLEETCFALKEQQTAPSGFTSIYGDEVPLILPAGFSFVLQRVAGYSPEYYYLAPSGTAKAARAANLQLGLSGTEYAGIMEGMNIIFTPGAPAWFSEEERQELSQTAYLAIPGASYYSQSETAPFYAPDEQGYYTFAQLPAFVMSGTSAIPVFPFFKGISGAGAAMFLERMYLCAIRREIVERGMEQRLHISEGRSFAVTRNGMAVMLEGGSITWLSAACAGRSYPDIGFTYPKPRFMAAFQANDLFLLLCGEEQVQGLADTPYSITSESLVRAKAGGYPYADRLFPLVGNTYLSGKACSDAVKLCTKEEQISQVLLDACDHFTVMLDGWTFFLGKRRWHESGSIFLIKLDDTVSLMDCLKNRRKWSLAPDEARATVAVRTVEAIEARAKELLDSRLTSILHDAGWKGCVCFYATVDCTNLPPELQFFSGGIDREKMKALYVEFPAATASVPEDFIDKSEVCPVAALIDYQDDVHQCYSDEREFAFKTLNLRVKFENGRVTFFSAKVELLMNRLFGGRVQAGESRTGNNMVFDGYYQHDGTGGRYVFQLLEEQCYSISGCGICRISITEGALKANGQKSRFLLGGNATLYTEGENDLLSYENIGFTGLVIEMAALEEGNRFSVSLAGYSFDLSCASARRDSFAACFPIQSIGMGSVIGRTPQQDGYIPLKCFGEPGEAEHEWYGLLWQIPLGNLGSLAAKEALSMELLTGWYPPDREKERQADGDLVMEAPKLFAGLKLLSNGNAAGWEVPLQGVLTLGFESIELHVSIGKTDGEKRVSYYFRFCNFALQILGFRFPHTNNDMYLIADETKTLGWYGAAGEE